MVASRTIGIRSPMAIPIPDRRVREREPASGSGLVGWRLDVLAALGLSALALAVRWPYLWSVPRFTDEVLEVGRGLAIARGQALPLTNYDSYLGAIQNYMLAALFLVVFPWAGPKLPFNHVTVDSTTRPQPTSTAPAVPN